jgi:aminoglycoside 3-N-acetyltransferase I
MPKTNNVSVHCLGSGDAALMQAMNDMFAAAFEDPASYTRSRPSDAYIEDLLSGDQLIAIAALRGKEVLGGLAAYELKKFEQERSEIYIYDLAVREDVRRRGIATTLIEELKQIGRDRGAYVIFVQADYIDPPAIALYSKLGSREDVLHFDIAVR